MIEAIENQLTYQRLQLLNTNNPVKIWKIKNRIQALELKVYAKKKRNEAYC